MKVGELTRALDQVRQLFVSAGTTSVASDLRRFIDVLSRQADREVDAFISEAREQLAASARKNSGPSARSRSGGLKVASVGSYLEELKGAGTGTLAFDRVFNKIKADKTLKLVELNEIVHGYSGGTLKYETIDEAHEAISKAFISQARFLNKLL